MRKPLFAAVVFLFIVSLNATVCSQQTSSSTNGQLQPEERQSTAMQLVSMFIERYHYSPKEFNDSLSSWIFDDYLKALDNQKMYFLQSDIDDLQKYRYVLDQNVSTGNLEPPFDMFNLYLKRMNKQLDYAISLLKNPLDFTANDTINLDRENAPYAKTEKELNALWLKRVKYDVLGVILGGKDEKEARELIEKRYENLKKAINKYKADDVFQIYMRSLMMSIDPHSNYMSPKSSQDFNINMSQSLEGIGATLTSENDYITIVKVITGGPAAKSGKLDDGDRIVAVGQGDDGEMVDIVGWRVDDAVQLIRGAKGTVVKLSILKKKDGANAVPVEIRLVREKIKIEEQSAKKKIIEIKEDGKTYKIGVIDLPSFYLDFEGKRKGEKDYKSTSNDVKKIIDTLKNEGVNAILMDLRNNGGGSLIEAIELTGLFIKTGPVVQVKDADGSIKVDKDTDPAVYWDGPLAVLVNSSSASASEIFAAAIQDYGRGVVLGEQTFGKGTVQNLVDLDRVSNSQNLGQLTLTIAKFYRISGGSTQHKGVIPDILFPSVFDPDEMGESSFPTALPWDKITASNYEHDNEITKILPELIELHKKRTDNSEEYQYLIEDNEKAKLKRNEKKVSLNLESRKKENEIAKQEEEARKKERANKGLIVLDDKGQIVKESLDVEDPLLEESGHILANLIRLTNGNEKKK
ncbi:MAG: carboxy terminal-processing peptidase [Ignavibacteriales bacterium]|nr:MAG: PDZ domain-containing protein [Ignavibacteriaceae bacterium]MBW7871803.1 carboxy terminal-processing peptidase [Ignavibacteria bacterium]MCZ2144347.1 carboxy terminal-processing peptidase [Ignavibacteriales bacterium]MBV6446300.1 Tail-specific protease [Ignavibacteriaceae bacterium]MBZ0198164.1 carboxy terminal-processing peptidase [Ignavibacteriaceae bacterium]